MRSCHLFFILFAFTFSSCIVFHSGSVSSGPLLNSNDKYTDIANGTSRSVFVFGFGNIKKTQLVQEAKKNLYLTRPLRKNEYYSNFTTDINKKFIFFIVASINVVVSADVLRSGDTSSVGFSPSYNYKITPLTINKYIESTPKSNFNGNLLTIGDSVYYSYNSKSYNLFVVSTIDKETVMLNTTNSNQRSVLALLQSRFFLTNKIVDGIKAGDKAFVDVLDKYSSTFVKEEGVVYGFSGNDILVKTKSGYYISQSDKLKK